MNAVSIKKWLYSLGPGLITAALVFGPSKITLTSKLGAEYGYRMIWIVVVAIFFMAVFTSMSARIGMATDLSLMTIIRLKFGKPVAIALGLAIFFVTAAFQAGNSIGVGIAVAEATHTSVVTWIVVCNLAAIALLFFRGFYKTLEKLMIGLIGLMLFAFLTTLFLVKPGAADIASGLIPEIPAGASAMLIAFIASCFSIVGAFYQSYLVQERRKANPGIIIKGNASTPGIVILGVLSAIVMVSAGTVLYPAGIHINTASDMARVLEPLFGKYASTLFLAGLFAASFSALVGNATVGGTVLGDAFRFGNRLSSRPVKYLIAVVILFGAVIALAFGRLPLELIVFAQSITTLFVPFIGIALFVIANDRKLMGINRNKPFGMAIGAMGLLLVIVLGVTNFLNLINH